MSAPSVPVKYLVVNHEKASGRFKAKPANNTVHTGNRVVNVSVVFKYKSHILLFVGVEAGTGAADATSDIIVICCKRGALSAVDDREEAICWLTLTNLT